MEYNFGVTTNNHLIYIFGEMHTDNDRNEINKEILRINKITPIRYIY